MDASSFKSSALLLINLCGLPSPRHHGGEEVVWLWHHLAMPRPAQLSPGSTHFTYLSDILSIQFVNSDFVVLFCSCGIFCVSVCPWMRDLSSVAFPEVSSTFFIFFSWICYIFPRSKREPKDRGCRSLDRL